ncbi:hypothetical protein HRR80_000729 [Exophiala dermatitidis]|uniref:Uncharacterized protein n=1 Tax=Exophiala dermatitidis TaxID=5970 RepID=A0AAN6F5Q3_EXODE|nr:hypothetical protein HRR80_000729 [Exophiala dermatitidis]
MPVRKQIHESMHSSQMLYTGITKLIPYNYLWRCKVLIIGLCRSEADSSSTFNLGMDLTAYRIICHAFHGAAMLLARCLAHDGWMCDMCTVQVHFQEPWTPLMKNSAD